MAFRKKFTEALKSETEPEVPSYLTNGLFKAY